MVSKASELFPEPLGPVTTMTDLRGRSRSRFLRLCCRAPRITILSFMARKLQGHGGYGTGGTRPKTEALFLHRPKGLERRGLGVFGAEAPKRAARAVGHDTAVPNGAGPTAARPCFRSADGTVQAVRRGPGPPGAHPSRSGHL